MLPKDSSLDTHLSDTSQPKTTAERRGADTATELRGNKAIGRENERLLEGCDDGAAELCGSRATGCRSSRDRKKSSVSNQCLPLEPFITKVRNV